MTNIYPTIAIKDHSNGISQTIPAKKITKHLAVCTSHRKWDTNTFRIMSIAAGRPAISHRISSFLDAIEIALTLEQVFGDYWSIHDAEEWRESNIPMISRYSVPDGVRTFVALSILENKDTISFSEFQSTLRNCSQ